MSPHLIFNYLVLWTVIGAAAFSLVVVYLFRSGRVYDARNEGGHLKAEMPRKGLLTMLGFLVLIIGFITLSNYLSLVRRGMALTYWPLFGLNLALILILIVYDTLVIDWWVIGHWRPAFLQLPAAMDKDQMKEHIRRSFVVAPLFGLLLAALSAGVTIWLW
ncbi:MAG: hypothetical protein JW757_08030 [Anaerolineales bacterium]|nr:hypothetical protein [Anaerolineales bacterium]